MRDVSPQSQEALLLGDYVALGYLPKRGKLEVVESYPYLKAVYQDLCATGHDRFVYFNQGLVKGVGYYTGIIFEGILPDFAQCVVSGGRYDGLMSRFGFDQPAVGFAINLSLLSAKRELHV
jgi:ATP phosphoribosyltransferase regulatory subunit